MRLFDDWDRDAIELTPLGVVGAPDVTHFRYRVEGPAVLARDCRVRDLQTIIEE
jgi:hypothetical protein